MTQFEQRDARQRELIDPRRLKQVRATIVGVGAIGRQVALQLAALGVSKIQIIDFDIVEEVNLAAQGFNEADLALPKVEAVKRSMEQVNSSIRINALNERYNELHGARLSNGRQVVFACVDDIEIRKLIFETFEFDLFVDTRMAAELIRTLAVQGDDQDARAAYDKTLFVAEEANRDRCTQQTTIYCANIGAALAVAQFTKWLRQMPVDADVMFNILSYDVMYITPDMLDNELDEETEEQPAEETDGTPETVVEAVAEDDAVEQLETAEE